MTSSGDPVTGKSQGTLRHSVSSGLQIPKDMTRLRARLVPYIVGDYQTWYFISGRRHFILRNPLLWFILSSYTEYYSYSYSYPYSYLLFSLSFVKWLMIIVTVVVIVYPLYRPKITKHHTVSVVPPSSSWLSIFNHEITLVTPEISIPQKYTANNQPIPPSGRNLKAPPSN